MDRCIVLLKAVNGAVSPTYSINKENNFNLVIKNLLSLYFSWSLTKNIICKGRGRLFLLTSGSTF